MPKDSILQQSKLSAGKNDPQRASITQSYFARKKNKQLVELNESVVLNNLDTRRTYFNSIMSSMQPKFKYTKRRNNQKDTGRSTA